MYTQAKNQNTRHVVSLQDDYEDEPYELDDEGEDQKQFSSMDEKPPVPQRRSQGRSQMENYSPSFNYEYSKDNHSRQYTPDISEGMGSIGYERSPEKDRDDFIKKLMDKIRRQAEQLIQLENYKLLCEKRILELAPDHPLPVELSHMGNTEYGNREIQELKALLKEKDDELNQMQREYRNVARRESPQTSEKFRKDSPSKPEPVKSYRGTDELSTNYNLLHQKYQELVNINRELEDSLREETLVSEEQRAYTEILKQMLNEKFDKNFIYKLVGGVPEKDKFNAIVEIKNLQDRLQQYSNQVANLTDQLNQQDAEMEKLREEREVALAEQQAALDENVKVSEMNVQLTQGIKECSDEIKRLEEEKESLINYAAEKENKYMEYSAECDSLRNENKALTEAYEHNKQDLKKFQDEIDKLNSYTEELKRKQLEHDPKLLALHEEKKQIEEEMKTNLTSFNETLVRIREEHLNLMNEKDNQVADLREEVARLQNEVRKYKDIEERKEREFQSKLRQYQNDRLREVRELETKMKIYLDNEVLLKDDISKREYEIQALQEELKKTQDDAKDLQNQIYSQKKTNIQVNNELEDLKRTIDEYEEERTVMNDRMNTLNRELNTHREETERTRTRLTEINEMNSTLEKRLQEKEGELNNYDYLIMESKSKTDRERHEKMDEIKRLYEENGGLKQELRQLKEDITRLIGETQGRDDEIGILKTYLDKKNTQNLQLTEESKYLNNRLADFHMVKEENEYLKSEVNKLVKEIKDFEDLLDNKNNNLRATREKLESAEQELLNVISDLKNVQREKAELNAENGRLKRRLTESEEGQRTLRLSKNEDEEKMREIIRDNDRLKRQLHDLTKELEDLASECQRVQAETQRVNNNEVVTRELNEKATGLLKEALHQVKTSVTTYSGLVQSNPEFEVFLSKGFVKLINDFNFLQYLKGDNDSVPKLTEHVKDILEIVMIEFESLWKFGMEIQMNFKESCQRINTLEKKCMEIGTDEAFNKKREAELQREIDYLKQEKAFLERDKTQIYNREQKIDKECIELKKEILKLQQEVFLQQTQAEEAEKNRTKIRDEWAGAKQQFDSEKKDVQLFELKSQVSDKAKENFDDLVQKISTAMNIPEQARVVKELCYLQREINEFERLRATYEYDLTYLDTQYKDTLRKSVTPGNQNKPQDYRNKVEDIKTDLRHANSQVNTLNKKKDILLNDLKTLTNLEKNGTQLLSQERKTLNELKKEMFAFRESNGARKSVLKTESNDRPSHDYDELAVKYVSVGSSNKEKAPSNYASASNLNKENQNQNQNYQYDSARKSIKDYASYNASAQSARYKSVERGETQYDSKVGSALKRYDPEPNVHMKLRDRLDHAKNMLSSIKKIHEDKF